jgi:hypothetical protein
VSTARPHRKILGIGARGEGKETIGPLWRGVCLVSVLALILADVANLILAAGDAGEGVYRRGAIAS